MDALALAPASHAALLTRASAALAAGETLPDLAALIDQAEVVRVAARKARLGRDAHMPPRQPSHRRSVEALQAVSAIAEAVRSLGVDFAIAGVSITGGSLLSW